MIYFGLLGLAVGLGLPLAVLGAALGQGNVAVAAIECITRQPEMGTRIQTLMILGMALIESLVIYVLLTFFLLIGKLPSFTPAQVMQIAVPASSAPANP